MIKTLIVLLGLFAIFYGSLVFAIGRKRAWCHLRWFLAVVPFGIFSFTSYIIYPFAYLIEKVLPNNNPLWWWLDDEIEDPNKNEDWIIWLANNGGKANFLTMYKWHANRNKMWNLNVLIKPKSGRVNCIENNEVVVDVIKNDLRRNGAPVSIYGKCLEVAQLKWIDKNGYEGWQVNQGVEVSKKYSTFGVSSLYYEVGDTLYYRYSYCFLKKILNSFYYVQIKYGTDEKGYWKTFKWKKKK